MPLLRRSLSACLLALLCCAPAAAQQTSSSSPNVVLNGDVRPSQAQTYIEAPFRVPEGTHRITVDFENLGREQHTVLDLGILDPFGFRGASGGGKHHFTISDTDATPSYLPGAIPAGTWKLLLAVPNIRPGVTTRWRAEIRFNRAIDDAAFVDHPLRNEARWYRGDLHMHTAHSDGTCPSQSGKPVPCPLFLTVDAAARRGLDFIAITDHNTTAQYNDERELQPYFDHLLLIPGREITTFYGHANMFGTTRFVNYRAQPAGQHPRSFNDIFRDAARLGAIVSINHPESPTGEVCMGCGWTPLPPFDINLVSAFEIVNGTSKPATAFWDDQLRQGRRLSAIGSSDNHRATNPIDKPGSIGYPTTVVYAASLSVPDILAGIRSGRVFVDVTGSRDRMLDVNAKSPTAAAHMGEMLSVAGPATVRLETHVVACDGASVHYLLDGHETPALPTATVQGADATLHASVSTDSARHWLRVEVRSADNSPLLIGNPIYINFPAPAAPARP